jgi:NAD(P)-dependent dehydrogenase (short-subunit alcohol dehydrogenase family)
VAPIGRFEAPKDAAEVMAMLASPASRSITGTDFGGDVDTCPAGTVINFMSAARGRDIPDQETS